MSVYIYIYVYIYIHMHIHVRTYVRMYIRTYSYVRMCMQAYLGTDVHACMHASCTPAYDHIHVHTHTLYDMYGRSAAVEVTPWLVLRRRASGNVVAIPLPTVRLQA